MPQLPPSNYEAHAYVNNISLLYAVYGPPVSTAGIPCGFTSRWEFFLLLVKSAILLAVVLFLFCLSPSP